MFKTFALFILGTIAGMGLLALVQVTQTNESQLGATPSQFGLIGVFNVTSTDLVLRDGDGSALAVDQNGQVITSSN